MSQRISRVSPLTAGKIFGAMYFVFGLVFAPLMALPILLSNDEHAASGLGFILALPFFYGAGGFVGMALLSSLYNVLAARIGGIEVEIEQSA